MVTDTAAEAALSPLLDSILAAWRWDDEVRSDMLVAADAAEDCEMSQLAIGLRLMAAGQFRPQNNGGLKQPWKWWSNPIAADLAANWGGPPGGHVVPWDVFDAIVSRPSRSDRKGMQFKEFDDGQDALIEGAYAFALVAGLADRKKP